MEMEGGGRGGLHPQSLCLSLDEDLKRGVKGTGREQGCRLLCHLMRCFEHLHEEGVDGRVPDKLKEEQVLQTLEADGAQRR